METKFNFSDVADRVVYVKAVAVADLPIEVQEAAEGREELFAVHDSDGQQIALVADRQMAFVLALQNDMQPVTVH